VVSLEAIDGRLRVSAARGVADRGAVEGEARPERRGEHQHQRTGRRLLGAGVRIGGHVVAGRGQAVEHRRRELHVELPRASFDQRRQPDRLHRVGSASPTAADVSITTASMTGRSLSTASRSPLHRRDDPHPPSPSPRASAANDTSARPPSATSMGCDPPSTRSRSGVRLSTTTEPRPLDRPAATLTRICARIEPRHEARQRWPHHQRPGHRDRRARGAEPRARRGGHDDDPVRRQRVGQRRLDAGHAAGVRRHGAVPERERPEVAAYVQVADVLAAAGRDRIGSLSRARPG
jgi:hypothetical protein